MSVGKRRAVSLAALGFGAILFAGTLYYVDVDMALATGRRLGRALPLALLASGLWHLTRTWAWSWCFERPRQVAFSRLVRIRLAAEAFSYLTISGVAGEPLKVVLLGDRIAAREATAAVALERIAYMIGTTIIVGIGSIVAMATQPLSPIWLKIFRGFAIGSGALAAGIALILIRRDSYILSLLRAADRAAGTHVGSGRTARFVADVGRQLADLVSGNGARLVVLTSASVIAYGCMSAEAWLILTAVGVPISFTGALAVETFSRVASFASAFIPASIGALEASSLAAVTAIGAAGAGAPLALARRLRGLFWAGVGLAIYPRGLRPVMPAIDPPRPQSGAAAGPTLLYFPCDPAVRVSAFARVAGLPVLERVVRSAFRAKYARVIAFATGAEARALSHLARSVAGSLTVVSSESAWRDALAALPEGEAVTAIGAGTVVAPGLLEDALSIAPSRAGVRDVAAGSEWPVTGVIRLTVADAVNHTSVTSALHQRLRRALTLPTGGDVSAHRARLVLRMRENTDIAVAERTIRLSVFKTTDDKPARFNRRISLPISIALIRTPLTANQLSVSLVAIGFYAGWLFSLGTYWTSVTAAFLSLAASILDGCDGEIARLKYQESALGCWIETIGDYSYYIAIFLGLTIGAVRSTDFPIFYWIGGVALAGTLVSFALLIYLRGRITAGRPERLNLIARQRYTQDATASWWSRLMWRLQVVATRCLMPYGIMALALVNLLPLVVVLAAIGGNVFWIATVQRLRALVSDDDETETVAA